MSRSTRTPWRSPPAASSRALTDTARSPHGERGRRDYRLAMPVDRRLRRSRARPPPAARARSRALRAERSAAIPYTGPWSAGTLDGLFELAAALERPVTLVANLATRHLWGGHAERQPSCSPTCSTASRTARRPTGRSGHFACVVGRVARAGRQPVCDRRHLPRARRPGRAPAAGRSAWPRRSSAATCPPGGMIVVVSPPMTPRGARRRRRARPARGRSGTTAPSPSGRCRERGRARRARLLRPRRDRARALAARRRARRAPGLGRRLGARQPRAHAARAARRAQPLRLDRRPAPAARRRHQRARRGRSRGAGALELLLCDIVEIDGQPWECCPRRFLREALRRARATSSARALRASFEHEFQLLERRARAGAAVLAGGAAAREPVPRAGDGRAARSRRSSPSASWPSSRAHQFEIPLAARRGPRERRPQRRAAGRSCARSPAAKALRASFAAAARTPSDAGNGVHIHLSLLDERRAPRCSTTPRPRPA